MLWFVRGGHGEANMGHPMLVSTSNLLDVVAKLRGLWSDCPVKHMLLPFDIFRVDTDGTHRCACVGTLDGAQSRVREFMEAWPAEYLVVSRATGQKISIGRDAAPVKTGEWH
jgi:hypothetical protein